MAGLLAGTGRCTLEVPSGIALVGYGDRWRGSRGALDPLFASALWLAEDGTNEALGLLTLDMLCLHEEVVARIRAEVSSRLGLPAARLMVACSHTHAAPVAYVDRASSARRRRWIRELVRGSVEAVVQAASSPEPVGLRVALGEAHVAVQRRERTASGQVVIGVQRDGFVDRTLGVLELASPEGRPRALLVSFACHPAILSPRNRRVTAEWPGVMRRELEAELGVPVLFVQGATGNLNPDHAWGDDDLGAMERIGCEVADAVRRARADLEPICGLPLRGARTELEVPVVERRRPDGSRESYRATGARRLGVPRFVVDPVLRHLYPWASRLRMGSAGRLVQPLEIQALRAGDFALVGHASETFSEIGAAIRSASEVPHTFFAGYANGMIGYLPTAAAHAAGGYEVEEAPLAYRVSGTYAPESEALAVERSLGLLSSLRESASPGA